MRNRGFYMHNRGRYFVQQGLGAAPVDTDAPTVPANLAASSITATGLTLTWDASTDNVGVTEYEVQQRLASGVNGDYVTIGTVAAPTVTLVVTGLSLYTAYRFRVRAKDAAGNASAWGPDDTGLLVDLFAFVAPAPNGSVNVVTPDGAGGAFIGGEFTQITDANGTHSRARVAHLDWRGFVTSWDPGSDQNVHDIVIVDADYVAVAKAYNATLTNNTLGGVDCRGFGLVHRGTGAALAWDPAVTYAAGVSCLAVDGGRIYRAGPDAAASNLRSHTIATQALDAWSPASNAGIFHLAVDGANVVTSHNGNVSIGGVTRNKFAKTSKTVSAGGVAGFNTAVNGGFEGYSTSFVGSSQLFVAGYNITLAGAQIVKGGALVDKDTGAAAALTLALPAFFDHIERHAVGFDRIVCHDGGNPIQICSLTSGAVLAAITVTGMTSYSYTVYGRKYWFPRADRCIVYGSMTALGSRVVSGTSRMFVIDVP